MNTTTNSKTAVTDQEAIDLICETDQNNRGRGLAIVGTSDRSMSAGAAILALCLSTEAFTYVDLGQTVLSFKAYGHGWVNLYLNDRAPIADPWA